jgi:Heparinase II/III-like protein/Heparinase II/III N-terminus
VTITSTLADIKSLGFNAPLRATYEASKRVGLHRIVFDGVASRTIAGGSVHPALRPPGDIPPSVAERTLAEAGDIVGGSVRLFGRPVPVGAEPDWHLVLSENGRWPNDPWWTIDIRSERRRGDVKWTWELARHRHLVVLARAGYLQPEGPFVDSLARHLRSWIDQNPLERGVNWYSNLEIALRAINWIQVLGLTGEALPGPLRNDMAGYLRHSARHLIADLPYTVSTMRNNHLLGDGLGLVALGQAFRGEPPAARWRSLGDRLMKGQLRRHMRPDGSMIEDSVSYHRFVLEMLILRILIGEAPAWAKLALMGGAAFLARLGGVRGAVPQYGDWDEGRLLTTSGDPSDLAGTIKLAEAITGLGASAADRAGHDEVAWYSPTGTPRAPIQAITDGSPAGGGIARLERGQFVVWLKAGSGPSHGHADLTSVALREENWIVGDPGTGTYNGDPRVRDYFRSSIAHAVLRVDGEDQLVPHRTFRWRHSARGAIGAPVQLPEATLMWGVHDAYSRLEGAPRLVRVVAVFDGLMCAADWVEGPPRPFVSSLPLDPSVAWNDPVLELADGRQLILSTGSPVSASRGSQRPFDGWWSETYGSAEPATRLEWSGVTTGPVAWCVDASGNTMSTSGRSLLLNGYTITVRFTALGVELVADSADVSNSRRLAFKR